MSGFHLFTLADIPVRMSPWFLVIVVYFSRGYDLATGMLFVLCLLISFLAHEFGHALVARHYKLQPQILLTGLGGLTGHQRPRNSAQEALIIGAGPAAGLLVAGVSFLALYFLQLPSPAARICATFLFNINLYLSLFNLLPMLPLDGGHLMQVVTRKIWKPELGQRIAHLVSLAVVITLAAGPWLLRGYFPWLEQLQGPMLLMVLGLAALQNIQALSQSKAAQVVEASPLALELLMRADAAFQAGDDDQATVLCHQLRGLGNVPPPLLSRAWTILGVAATRKGDHEEALSYLQRAPEIPEVVEAKAQCFYELGRFDALESLVSTHGFARLPVDTRKLILEALRDALHTRTSEPSKA